MQTWLLRKKKKTQPIRLTQTNKHPTKNLDCNLQKCQGNKSQRRDGSRPKKKVSSVQFSRSVVSDSCDPINCRVPGLPVHHQLPEFTQTHIHWNITTKCKTRLCTGSFCYKEYNMVNKLSDLSRRLLCINVNFNYFDSSIGIIFVENIHNCTWNNKQLTLK